MRHLLGIVLGLVIMGGTAQAEEELRLTGPMVGAGIGSRGGASGFARYWSEYIGAELSLGVSKRLLEAEGGQKLEDVTAFDVSAFALAGTQVGRAKPYFAFGLGGSVGQSGTTDVSSFALGVAIGVDFLPTEHLVLGLQVLSFGFLVAGSATPSGGASIDISGHTLSVFSGLSAAYRF